MAAKKAKVTIRGGFPSGTKVKLYERTGDFFSPGGAAIKVAKVKDDGSATFAGLEEGGRYWAVATVNDQVRPRAVVAKLPQPGKVRQERPTGHAAADTRPPVEATSGGRIVTGPRGTKRAVGELGEPFANSKVGLPTEGTPDAAHPRQEDASGPQRSDTITGSAEPVTDAPERQDQVSDKTLQRSATPLGEATPLPVEEKPKRSARKRAAKKAPAKARKPAKKSAKAKGRGKK